MNPVSVDAPQGPLVSIIIPTYNCERYIEGTLRSVLGQSHRPIEVLVVDDGSTDRTPEIVAAHGEPVRLIRQANHGVCVARNHGFQQSKGALVCFLDHDDHWFDWKLACQVEAFERDQQLGVAFTDFQLWFPENGAFPDPARLAPASQPAPDVDAEFTGYIYHQFLLDCFALTSTVMMRREVFAASGGFDPALPYSEDWDLWLRLAREHRFIKHARVSTLYRQHPEQGNRKLRQVDYRTELLEHARQRWGLASADGRSVELAAFRHNLARYHSQFALHQLLHGQRRAGARSMFRAWLNHPARGKYLAVAAAALMGWKPNASGW
jgi:hypothetical protein